MGALSVRLCDLLHSESTKETITKMDTWVFDRKLTVRIVAFQVLSFQFHKSGQFSLKKVSLVQPTFEKQTEMSIEKDSSSVKFLKAKSVFRLYFVSTSSVLLD